MCILVWLFNDCLYPPFSPLIRAPYVCAICLSLSPLQTELFQNTRWSFFSTLIFRIIESTESFLPSNFSFVMEHVKLLHMHRSDWHSIYLVSFQYAFHLDTPRGCSLKVNIFYHFWVSSKIFGVQEVGFQGFLHLSTSSKNPRKMPGFGEFHVPSWPRTGIKNLPQDFILWITCRGLVGVFSLSRCICALCVWKPCLTVRQCWLFLT
jgi:hypothetical protein